MADSAGVLENLDLQLSEVEMLRSMYPNEEELHIDEEALADVQEYVSSKIQSKPSRLNFTLRLDVDRSTPFSCSEEGSLNQVELFCTLPQDYPKDKPDLFARSQQLNREVQKEMNSALEFYLSTIESGELCVLPAVEWIQENAVSFLSKSRTDRKSDIKSNRKDLCEIQGHTKRKAHFSRMWLYMHHIYNKTKRKNILAWASDYDLTGFCLPGKPGVVCIEGDKDNVEEYYSHLRRLSWKKITCRHQDIGDKNVDVDEQRKFQGFLELKFDAHGTRETHLDMGQFFQYLSDHGLSEMFHILFGVEGKCSDN